MEEVDPWQLEVLNDHQNALHEFCANWTSQAAGSLFSRFKSPPHPTPKYNFFFCYKVYCKFATNQIRLSISSLYLSEHPNNVHSTEYLSPMLNLTVSYKTYSQRHPAASSFSFLISLFSLFHLPHAPSRAQSPTGRAGAAAWLPWLGRAARWWWGSVTGRRQGGAATGRRHGCRLAAGRRNDGLAVERRGYGVAAGRCGDGRAVGRCVAAGWRCGALQVGRFFLSFWFFNANFFI